MAAIRDKEEEKQKQMNGGGPTAGSVPNQSGMSTGSGTNKKVLSQKTFVNENAAED